MAGVNLIVGNDGGNDLQGGAGKDLIYGFDPNGPQGQVSSIAATRVATGLSTALFAAAPPGDAARLFVVEQTGAIRIVDLSSGQVLATPFLNVAVDSGGERGLLGLAFDPDYATNGFFYIYRTVPGPGVHNAIERYHVSADPNIADPTATPIISLGNLSAGNHNGGWIGFGPDGYLYAATGDNAVAANAQSAANLLGKIVRIDVHNDAFPGDLEKNYAIPPDNMFAATAGADEIFALGLRNPFRDGFDRGTGDLFIADVGESSFEEINIGQGGANYGWPLYEGPIGGGDVTVGTLTAPIHSYDRTVGRAVIGGYVYRGESEGLQGQYFFADQPTGKVFTLRFNGNTWAATERTPPHIDTDVGTIDIPTSFGEDGRGNLYIVDYDGDVFRLTPLVASADQNDNLHALAGDDMVFGGSGDDRLDGGSGRDTLIGGAGNDKFAYAPGGGADIVTDFLAGAGSVDQIILAAFNNIHALGDVLALATQNGGNTVINFGNGDTLTLQGVLKANLSVDDFIFAKTSFAGAGSWTGAGNDTQGWYVGDFNGDGRDDIFRHNAGVSGAEVFTSNGFAFVFAGSWTSAGNDQQGWYVGDFNGDGRDDIFRHSAGVSGAEVFLSNGSSFGNGSSWTGAGNDGRWYVGDFNGDGRDDIFRYSPGVSGAEMFLSNGSAFVFAGSWTPAGNGNDNQWHIGDFNGDGRDDIFRHVAGVSGAEVFLSNGSSAFDFAGSWTGAGNDAQSWYVGDFNGDGRDDIFRHNAGVSGAEVFLSNGTSAFGFAGSWTGAGNDPQGWYVGDFNGGGADDIFRHMSGVSGADMWLST